MTPLALGKFIVLVGLVVVMVGLLVWSGALNWFGRLPGDIRIERPGTRIYIPVISLLLISAAFNLLVWLVRRILP
jgi:hypothetical protein